jgi:tellurite resistance protein
MIEDLGLSRVEPERLQRAVRAALGQGSPRLPAPTTLRRGAEETKKDEAQDGGLARRFQALLEVGYLVASADGFAEAERHTLAALLEDATQRTVDHEAFETHFRDLDEACEMLGRRERLRRAAEDFEDGAARREALGFAVLVAIADGKLGSPEGQALRELGSHLGFDEREVDATVGEVIMSVKSALGA